MTLSQLVRGDTNHCKFCKECDSLGNCTRLNRCVGWEMANDREVKDCPKGDKNEEENRSRNS